VAVAEALGATVEFVIRWDGEGLDRLLDEGHATLVDRVVAWLRAHGWEVAVEVSFARAGERGSIDILAWHPVRRAQIRFARWTSGGAAVGSARNAARSDPGRGASHDPSRDPADRVRRVSREGAPLECRACPRPSSS
jgi:hypothetical protein